MAVGSIFKDRKNVVLRGAIKSIKVLTVMPKRQYDSSRGRKGSNPNVTG
jgi:hypothetical protein